MYSIKCGTNFEIKLTDMPYVPLPKRQELCTGPCIKLTENELDCLGQVCGLCTYVATFSLCSLSPWPLAYPVI